LSLYRATRAFEERIMRAARLVTDNEGKPVEWVQVIPAKEWYPVQEASIILKMGTTQIYDTIKRGTMDAYEVNSVTHIKHEDLIEYIERRHQGYLPAPAGETQITKILPTRATRRAQRTAKAAQPEPGQLPEHPPQPAVAAAIVRPGVHIPMQEEEPTDGLNLDALDLGEDGDEDEL
jgi:hypothetical protein